MPFAVIGHAIIVKVLDRKHHLHLPRPANVSELNFEPMMGAAASIPACTALSDCLTRSTLVRILRNPTRSPPHPVLDLSEKGFAVSTCSIGELTH